MLGILGLGAFGSALANIAANNSLEVFLWGKEAQVTEVNKQRINQQFLPDIKLANNINIVSDLELVTNKCRDLLIAVPSYGFHDIVKNLLPLIKPDTRIAWVTKGLEPKTGKFLSNIVEENFGKDLVYGLLSGPSFAKEIANKVPTAIVAASNNEAFAEDLVAYLQQDWLKIYINSDLIGVQLGGACKNIYAVAAGIVDGLNYGANTKSALITRSLAELGELTYALGGKMATVMGLAVCGDLILTCTDNQSRNRRFGLNIANGMSMAQAAGNLGGVVEAKYNVAEICKLAEQSKVDLPIARGVQEVLNGRMSPKDLINSLFDPSQKYESKDKINYPKQR